MISLALFQTLFLYSNYVCMFCNFTSMLIFNWETNYYEGKIYCYMKHVYVSLSLSSVITVFYKNLAVYYGNELVLLIIFFLVPLSYLLQFGCSCIQVVTCVSSWWKIFRLPSISESWEVTLHPDDVCVLLRRMVTNLGYAIAVIASHKQAVINPNFLHTVWMTLI